MSGEDRKACLPRSGHPPGRWWLKPVAALAIIPLAAMAWLLAGQFHRSPVYGGKSLALWLRTYAPSSSARRNSREWNQADEAVRQIGTNCLPVLLRMLRQRDSKLMLELVAIVKKQWVIKTHFVPAAELNVEASRAFIALGDMGKEAVPALVKVYDENISDYSRRAILDSLAWIGPGAKPALPVLFRACTNSDPRLRANAFWALGEIHAGPQWCIPELIRGLDDSDSWARLSAAHALGQFGEDARPAVSKLTELAKFRPSPSGTIQEGFEARNALRKISPPVESFPAFDLPLVDSPISKP